MVATITFDTLKSANRLEAAGVVAQHAEAEASSEVFETNLADLATKKYVHDVMAAVRKDLQILESRLDGRSARVHGERLLLKRMLGIPLAGVASLILKALF